MARKRFESLIESNPKVVDAYVALADLNVATGQSAEEVRKVLDRGLAANPDSIALKIALVRDDLRVGNSKAALARAEEIQAAAPNDPCNARNPWPYAACRVATGTGGRDVWEALRIAPGYAWGAACTRAGAARNKNPSGAEQSPERYLHSNPICSRRSAS